MKFMISSRHPLGVLKNASEIRVNYSDIERIRDLVTEDWTCTADINIYIPRDQEIDWAELDTYKNLLKLIIAAEDASLIVEAKNKGYRAFWAFPASSYWELRGLLDLGVDEVLLDAPLYFDIPKVKNLCGDVEIRLQVNKCMNGYMKRKNGICGTYVRPEDVSIYEQYVDHMEFDADNSLEKEYTLLKVYQEQKNWPGNLNLLLTYLGVNVDNRGFDIIPNELELDHNFARRRIRCGQRCQSDPYRCHFCEETFKFINTLDADNDKIKTLIDKANNQEDS